MLTTTLSKQAATERRFFAFMALASVAIVFAGFATSYYLWPITRATHYPAGQSISPALPLLVHLHAMAFSAWVILLIVQTALVTQNNVAAHRRLGTLGAGLLPVIVVTAVLTAVRGARDGWNPGGPFPDSLSFMFVGIADLIVFISLTTAGLWWRSNPTAHRRLMILGTIGGLMWPAITRMPLVAGKMPLMFGLLIALVLAPTVHDLITRSRGRWVSVTAGIAILATFPLRIVIGNSTAWRALAAWVIQL